MGDIGYELLSGIVKHLHPRSQFVKLGRYLLRFRKIIHFKVTAAISGLDLLDGF